MLLTVRPISAILDKDTDTIGKSDPYVILILGKQKRRGKQCNDGGTKPSWNQPFDFTVKEQVITIQVWDKDTVGSDDQMGTAVYDLSKVYSRPNSPITQNIKLAIKGKQSGVINVEFLYRPGPGQNQPNQPQWGGQNQPNQQWGGQNQQWGGQNQPNQPQWGGQNQPNQQWGGQNQPNQQWGGQGGNLQGQNKPGQNNQGGFIM